MEFIQQIKTYYQEHKRNLPWRNTIDPYAIVVSEIMLQQTQVPRVLLKYSQFLNTFPTFVALQKAAIPEVLAAWQGMGYNRRALYLKKIAEIISDRYKGLLPQDPELLQTFPGIGWATARSIAAFAYNLPTVFIETNIRRVYLHHFFAGETNVSDKQILPLVAETLDRENPRDWYYALMDYGTMLGKTSENANQRSKHYQKQSRFSGSPREIRGFIVKQLVAKKQITEKELLQQFPQREEQIIKVLKDLQTEGFIRLVGDVYLL